MSETETEADAAAGSDQDPKRGGATAAARKARREALHQADRKAMRVAARQWSALARPQAIKAGLTRTQIMYRLQTGRWRQPVRGVYVVDGAPDRWEQRAMIACLAGPENTVASHVTAAALFALAKPPEVPQVTIPPRASGRFKGAQLFRARLGPGEVCIRLRVPCTSPVRTVVDCAGTGLVDGEELWDLVDSALCRKLMQPSRLVRASGRAWSTARGRRRGGLEGLERTLDVWRSGAPPGSPPEARLQRKLIEWGFPQAERQVEVYDGDGTFVARADLGLRDLKVLFEYDSDEHHGPRCWIADDARKDRLVALGWTVIVVDRFDLRPSSTRLKEVLEQLTMTRFGVPGTQKRVGAIPSASSAA